MKKKGIDPAKFSSLKFGRAGKVTPWVIPKMAVGADTGEILSYLQSWRGYCGRYAKRDCGRNASFCASCFWDRKRCKEAYEYVKKLVKFAELLDSHFEFDDLFYAVDALKKVLRLGKS